VLDPNTRPITRAGRLLLVGIVLAVAACALVIHDLSHANRPHELKLAPHVFALSVLGSIVGIRILVWLMRAWRERREHPLRWYQYAYYVVGAAYACLTAFLVIGSFDTLMM